MADAPSRRGWKAACVGALVVAASAVAAPGAAAAEAGTEAGAGVEAVAVASAAAAAAGYGGRWETVPTYTASEIRRARLEEARHEGEVGSGGGGEWVVHQRRSAEPAQPRFREEAHEAARGVVVPIRGPSPSARSAPHAPEDERKESEEDEEKEPEEQQRRLGHEEEEQEEQEAPMELGERGDPGDSSHRFAETHGIWGAIKGAASKVGKFVSGVAKGAFGLISAPKGPDTDLSKLEGDAVIPRMIGPEDIEDCVACQFVWRSIENEVGNTQVSADLYDSLQRNCIAAEKSKIFYPACETMLDAAEDMIANYVEGDSVLAVCDKAGLGCNGERLGGAISFTAPKAKDKLKNRIKGKLAKAGNKIKGAAKKLGLKK